MEGGEINRGAEPGGSATATEDLGRRVLSIDLVGRDRELADALAHCLPEEGTEVGRTLIVRGDSGTGKTFFSRTVMRELGQVRPASLFLYIDVADDEYQSSRTLAALLRMSLVPGPMTNASVVSVPPTVSLESYRREAKRRKLGRGLLRALARAAGTFLGLGGAVGSALETDDDDGGMSVENELVDYLAWVADRSSIFIAIDNLQFLNLEVRLTIESVLQRVDRNVRLIAVDRTVDGVSELNSPIRCFGEQLKELTLGRFSEDETRQLVTRAINDDGPAALLLADDIFTKTGGLAKDVEYCLRRYSLELGRGARVGAIEGLLSTIDRLPLIHRQFLTISTLLTGGVRKEIARGAVARLTSLYADPKLDQALDDLLTSEYLRINSESGDRLRPGHERIATAMRELADEDLHEEVRRSLVEELEKSLEDPSEGGESETYLLHCLVGLQTARQLSRNLHQVSHLIQSQCRQDQFSYLVAISAELWEILPMLPEHALNDLLDAMQKSSAFEQGLALVQLLDKEGVPGVSDRRVFRLRYLTQAYQYKEALELSEEIGSDGWGAVYRINALMSLHRNEEAREIAVQQLKDEMDECQAVLRRITITLFDSDTALRHLDQAYEYFQPEGSEYRLATIETNRSLVHIHRAEFGSAEKCLETAQEKMRFIGSGEIFQAQINLAVRAALLGQYERALRWLKEASLRVPRALLLDQVKIESDRVAIEAAAGLLSNQQVEARLEECLRRIQGVQMPEIRSAVVPNLARARGESPPPGPQPAANRQELGMKVGLPPTAGTQWDLLMSIHWRY
jgi:tetratricopeptide (TPR) repeat protein